MSLSQPSAQLRIGLLETSRGPIELARMGSGPALIMVHGIPGSWRQLLPLAEDLADGYDVIMPSRPGYGSTPVTTGRSPIQQAAAYAAMLDEIGIESAAIMGVSGGGPSSLYFAATYPERTIALVLCCAVAHHLIKIPPFMRLGAVKGLGEALQAVSRWHGRRAVDNPKAVDRAIAKGLTAYEQRSVETDPRVREDLVRFQLSHLEAPSPLEGMRNDLIYFRLAARVGPPPADLVKAPTLVLHGDTDPTVPLSHGRFHAEAIEGATLDVYKGAGHLFLLTRRTEAEARIREFLASAVTRAEVEAQAEASQPSEGDEA